MAYKVIILYRLYMPSYFLGTFTEYPYLSKITDTFRQKSPALPIKCLKAGDFVL